MKRRASQRRCVLCLSQADNCLLRQCSACTHVLLRSSDASAVKASQAVWDGRPCCRVWMGACGAHLQLAMSALLRLPPQLQMLKPRHGLMLLGACLAFHARRKSAGVSIV